MNRKKFLVGSIIKISLLTTYTYAATLDKECTDAIKQPPVEKVTQTLNKERPKRRLICNMNVIYLQLPGSANSLTEMFKEGMFYGRLRSNTFYWDWKNEVDGKSKDNKSMGIGGSLIYKSARYHGWSGTVGVYTSQNPRFFRVDDEDVQFVKAGNGTFSRYHVQKSGDYEMTVLGQAYVKYENQKTAVRVGRQLFYSVFTSSNDTKMVPNSFDGITLVNKALPKITVRAAYFTAQKLRDHTHAHDVITYQDSRSEAWNNNDDSAIHRGLSYSNFLASGKETEHDLIIVDAKNRFVKNLTARVSYLAVPGVVQDVVAEAHYKILMKNGWVVRPGIRYFYQGDDGGGAVAGDTNLKGKPLIGYTKGVNGSFEGSLTAFRVDAILPDKKGFLRFGYSAVEDKADIIAPWRGFPTGGFTRAMAQYNWYANTKTYMARAMYKFTPKFITSLRYVIQDFDDKKVHVQADSDVWHFDTITKFTRNLEMKTRVGLVNSDTGVSGKPDDSYREYRLEFNYLF